MDYNKPLIVAAKSCVPNNYPYKKDLTPATEKRNHCLLKSGKSYTTKGRYRINLIHFLSKSVKIVTTNGLSFSGFVGEYFYPEDNENGKESIAIETAKGDIVEFYKEDMGSIEIIED